MMKYVSTRDACGDIKINSAEAIKQGLAKDGGLFMPCEFVKISADRLKQMQGMVYENLAAEILSLYLTDYEKDTIKAIAKKAYSKENFAYSPAVITKLDGRKYVLELYHGPTCAFKDMALQIMPHLLSEALNITREERNALVLVATSGDTGKAALEGFKNISNIDVSVFYPKDGVSKVQKLQMDTQEGNNVNVCAVKGNFDDCQTGVKNIFNNIEIKKMLEDKKMFFSSANSINFGRLIPQVVYYFYAYLRMAESGGIERGEKIDICVPTGNFGNIFAGYIAKEMGLPIDKLICASNQNNVITEFLQTGEYNRNREFYTTMSPSMDILISSNLERLLYVIAGTEENIKYMENLKSVGQYTISDVAKEKIDKTFTGFYCSEANMSNTIKQVFKEYNYLIDTHTAVAFACAEEYIRNCTQSRASEQDKKVLIVSTASAYKFADDVYFALTGNRENDELNALTSLAAYTKTEIPTVLKELSSKKIRFNNCVEVSEMKNYTIEFMNLPRTLATLVER